MFRSLSHFATILANVERRCREGSAARNCLKEKMVNLGCSAVVGFGALLLHVFQAEGVLFHQLHHGMPCTFGLAASSSKASSISSTRSFDPTGDGTLIWKQLANGEGLCEIGFIKK